MLGIYCRISKNREGQKSIKEQRLQGEEFAKRNSLDFKTYIDEGISGGGDTDKRIAFTSLINDIEKNVVTSVFLSNQDRLEREEVTWFKFANLILEKDITLYEDGNLIDLDDAGVYFSRGVMSQANAFYRKGLSKKIKQVLYRNLSEGKVHAIAPYGYKKDITNAMIIDEVLAEYVKRIYHLSLNGIGINKIAEIFNGEGVPTKYNSFEKGGTITVKNKYTGTTKTRNKSEVKWSGNTIRGIITNTTYKGVRMFGGVEYSCPAIFDKHYWNKVNDNLKNNRNNSGVSTEHKYLLKGLMRCGRCNSNYYGRTRINKKDNYYMCSSKRKNETNCGNRSINIDVLDDIIWSRFIGDGKLLHFIESHFSNMNTDDIVIDLKEELKALEGKLKVLDKERSNIINSIRKGIINDDEVASDMNSIRIEKDILEAKIYNLKEQLNSYSDSSNSLDGILNDLNFNARNVGFNDKKDILNKYIKDIRIYYEDNDKNYFIEMFFNILNMENVVYIIENNYKYAYPTIDFNSKEEQEKLIITLDKKMESDMKNGIPLNYKIMVNSKQVFESLKLKYNK
jgi:site-specific DNA recombinase